MGDIYSFLSSVLPNMRTQDFTARSENEMCTCMVVSKLYSTFTVDFSFDCHSYVISLAMSLWQRPIKLMQDRPTNLFNIDHFIFLPIDYHDSQIILLSTRCWIESRLIQHDQIGDIFLLYIFIYFNYLADTIEMVVVLSLVIMEKMLSRLDM